ncbi:hypothetical protein J6590_058810 [Homalodisca vitripennis]|nr:hypothetical protein J6590_058810 [Homalodisca vitripennis]
MICLLGVNVSLISYYDRVASDQFVSLSGGRNVFIFNCLSEKAVGYLGRLRISWKDAEHALAVVMENHRVEPHNTSSV